MKAGVTAVLINLVFNYLLIYGKFGFPELGVVGAAAATVLSRYVEAIIVLFWTHRHSEKNTYIIGLYRTLKVPMHLVTKFIIKGCPLLVNEAMWSCAMTMLVQCYSVRGLNVVAGLNIANTLNNLFSIVFIALGDAVGILVGQLLGAGKMKEARDTDNKLIAFSTMSCFAMGILLLLAAPFFPNLYNTTDDARSIATSLITVQAIFMPLHGFLHSSYFTLRSGGKTIITFLFDGAFVWLVSVPIAFVLSRFTGLPVVWIFTMVQLGDCIKAVLGFILVKKGVWIQNIVSTK
jgi:Na+-driven multidrug efflux pump